MSDICYLCYDVKGIQQFIFSIPKLKYIVGASLLIDEFDQETKKIAETMSVKWIFSGGGKGTFFCKTRGAADEFRDKLVDQAHLAGLDLRIGIDPKLSEATRHADDLYPIVPDELDGEPCSVSGLWPTTKKIHPLVAKRAKKVKEEGERVLDARVLNHIRGELPDDLLAWEKTLQKPLEFLTAVRAEDSSDEDFSLARAADAALGNRNRWAVFSMDGNDMGCQFRAFEAVSRDDQTKLEWMTAMSGKLKASTQGAFCAGLAHAITEWWKGAKENENLMKAYEQAKTLVLPFRPLIIGGDDILCLCHCSYVIEMAKTIAQKFAELSRDANEDYKAGHQDVGDLWPGTGGELSISAGIAFTGVTLPLSLSIPYAEQLLAGAKRNFRRDNPKPADGPTPSAVDWESVTESMIDTPTARRNRDLTFIDKDLGGKKIVLTMRPYLFSSEEGKLNKNSKTLNEVEVLKRELNAYPRSVLTELMTILTLPWGERVPRLAAMAAQRPEIFDWLDEGISNPNSFGKYWISEDGSQKTCFLDAISLLEEEKRMEKETVQ